MAWSMRYLKCYLVACKTPFIKSIIMWASRITPVSWKTSDIILIDKNRGAETEISSYRPRGLANTLYKLWIHLVTNALYE